MHPRSERPSFDTWALLMAYTTARRATCSRRAAGAVVVRDKRIVSTGYNGAPAGLRHCDHTRYLDDPGADPDLVLVGGRPSCARAVHAEANAITYAARFGVALDGCTLYCTTHPCLACARLLVSAGVREVVFVETFPEAEAARALFLAAGVELTPAARPT